MMPSPSGHRDSLPYTNGHISPLAVHAAPARSSSQHSDSDLSDAREPAAPEPSSDIDAPGEEDDDDERMAADSDSSADVDAEGEPDGDYDSDSPPSEHAPSSRAQSVSSQESSRPLKRKASADKEDYMTRDPELYGLRRSVSAHRYLCKFLLTTLQGRARPSRRIVGNPRLMNYPGTNLFQVDSDDEDEDEDEDDDSDSDQPRKRQRTASRKGLHAPWTSSTTMLTLSLASNQPTPVYRATGSDSESDGYVNAKKNIPTRKERQRQLLVAEGRLPPSQAEVRFSARRTAQRTNYNEDGEDSFEEEEDETTPNYWAVAEEDAGPIIDKILDHRPKEGSGNTTTCSAIRVLTTCRTRPRLCPEKGLRVLGKRASSVSAIGLY
jgi:chromodomain-helicase-DNA-binding protein 1